ncbi:MarR family winged helix-turn-helix transcriptional regulator [Hungatella sp. SB206]|uniref:MarR family winged helix-turn-helix transcriptional regulator n=1 Tax=Hungatella sp. SB206 TaxID=2937758 RepID=UPI003DA9E176
MDTGKLINKISIRLRRRSEKMGKNLGITEVQGRILDFILVDGKDRPLYQKDIEKEFGLRPSTATELLKTLESRKMIQRVSSEEDGRYKKIQFTEAAEDIRMALQQEIQKTEGVLVEGISREDLNTFMKVAEKMLENLER